MTDRAGSGERNIVDMNVKPLIGLSVYTEPASWGDWAERAALLPHDYVAAVVEAGAVPVLLPAAGGGPEARDAVSALDALVLTGGNDVDPARYGEAPHERTVEWRPERDAWEIELLRAALSRDIPVLGVCRGAQLMNVAFGGSLRQHVPDDTGHERHGPAGPVYGTIDVVLDPDALPGRVLDVSVDVPCHHHQAIGRLGEGLTVTGRAVDGTIEAIELAGRRFVCAVQWHPEAGKDPRLMRALAEAAHRNRFEKGRAAA